MTESARQPEVLAAPDLILAVPSLAIDSANDSLIPWRVWAVARGRKGTNDSVTLVTVLIEDSFKSRWLMPMLPPQPSLPNLRGSR